MPLTPPNQTWGELSFREIDGHPVLAGPNFYDGKPEKFTVEVHVGTDPTTVIGTNPTVVVNNIPNAANSVLGPYGGYILPGSTLDNLGLFGSQWNGPHYDVQHVEANVKPSQP
jgi:hypothetical protein